MSGTVNVKLEGRVVEIETGGASEQAVMNELKNQLVSAGNISENAKQVFRDGVYSFEEQHGEAGI